MELRPYQNEAVRSVLETWEQGVRSALLVLPTGTGKTVVFSAIGDAILRRGGRLLILAHRAELLEQAQDKFERLTGIRPQLEQAESTTVGSWCNAVVGSVQSFNDKRLERFVPDDFTHIIIDEAHHTLAVSYMRVLSHFPDAHILGVTATADRGDKRNLGEFFQVCAYEMSLATAIKDGWLSPIRQLTIPLDIELAAPRSGDWSERECASAIEPYLERIADEMASAASDRKSVVFLPLIATAQRFCALLNARGLSAREVNGQSEDRAETLAWFRDAPKGSVICNAMLLTEGWDEPSADCVVVLRPTKVRSLYAQMVGRGTRLSPGKENLLVLDFLWHVDRHSLCRPAHLVCRNPELADRVSEILAQETEETDLLEAEESAESTVQQEREEALRRELEAQRQRRRQLVDPLQYEASIDLSGSVVEYHPDERSLSAMGPPTETQLAALEKWGIYPEGVTCMGHASRILATLALRREQGLSSPKQIRLLERYGFRQVGTWTSDAAKKMVAVIAANAWYVPRNINPSTYRPEK